MSMPELRPKKIPHAGLSGLSKDLWWCACGRGLGGQGAAPHGKPAPPVQERWKFCPRCGAELDWDAALAALQLQKAGRP